LSAARLPGRNAWLVLPGVAAFLEIDDLSELGHAGGRQVRKAKHHRLDTGEGQVPGFELPRHPAEAPVEALDNFARLAPIGRLQDLID
jgi:hypothetical protein